MDADRAAAQLPAVEGEVVLQCPCTAGRVVRVGWSRSPEVVTSSSSSSGTTPLNGLCVASQRLPSASHWYIGKP